MRKPPFGWRAATERREVKDLTENDRVKAVADKLAAAIDRIAATATTAAELEALAAVAHEYIECIEYCRLLLSC